MARKRILKKTQSDSDDSFDEEEAIKIYSKNPYEPRLPTDLVSCTFDWPMPESFHQSKFD